MRGNDGTTDRKAQPHSLCFCGEKWLEDFFHFFLLNAVASIGDGHDYGAAPVLDSSTDKQSALRNAAITHRIASIDQKVE
jgi:hypothetical protein